MLSMLVAYDVNGHVIATLDYMTAYDDNRRVIGLVDFAAQEASGKLRDVWDVQGAVGSGTWPEWIGARAHDFRVELTGKWIDALVHKTSGVRRERKAIEAEMERRRNDDGVADARDLLGGPDRPLILDAQGRTTSRVPTQRPNLPVAPLARGE